MSKKAPRANRPVSASTLFRRILPDNFRQKSATIAQFQQFFHDLDADAVFAMVQVLDVTDTHITLGLPSSALVNYLRLHGEELRAEIGQQFGVHPQLKIVTLPEALQSRPQRARLAPARHFNDPVCDRVEKSAAGIDDDDLRSALLRLSRSIREDN